MEKLNSFFVRSKKKTLKVLFKILEGRKSENRLIMTGFRMKQGILIVGDISEETMRQMVFRDRLQGGVFIRTEVRTGRRIYVQGRRRNHDGFCQVNSAAVLPVSKNSVFVTDIWPERKRPKHAVDIDLNANIRAERLLLDLRAICIIRIEPRRKKNRFQHLCVPP